MSRRLVFRSLLAVILLALLAWGGAVWFTHRLLADYLSGRAFATEAAPVTDPLIVGFRGDPGTAFGYAFDEVMIDTELGPAPAWYVPGDPAVPPAPFAAIYVHGIGSAREEGFGILPILHQAGIPVLLISYRKDAGAPPDTLHRFGLAEWRDLEAASLWLQAQGQDRQLITAASMGGAIVGQFLAQSPQAERAIGLVLYAPALDFPMVLDFQLGRFGVPFPGLITPAALRLFALTHGLDLSLARSLPALAKAPVPLFLSHGTADQVVPLTISHRLLTLRQGETTYVQGAGTHQSPNDPDRTKVHDPALRAFLVRLGASGLR